MSDDAERRERQLDALQQRRRSERTEHVASWYFRLNGFLSIPGFVVHPDIVRVRPLTEADLIAVRFPNSREVIAGRDMIDDQRLVGLASANQILFLLAEVKLDLCRINGPWSDARQGNMQRVIRRLGFADEQNVDQIAASMYQNLRWEDGRTVLQYVAVGNRTNDGVGRTYPGLFQLTWDDIAIFMFERFQQFPEKLPADGRSIHEQWPDFGKAFGRTFRRMTNSKDAIAFVWSYIDEAATGRE